MYNQAVDSSPFWSKVGICSSSRQRNAHYIWKRQEEQRLLSLNPLWFSLYWSLAGALRELMSCTMAENGTSFSRDSLGLFLPLGLLPSCSSKIRAVTCVLDTLGQELASAHRRSVPLRGLRLHRQTRQTHKESTASASKSRSTLWQSLLPGWF